MDDPNALATAATQLQSAVHTFQQTVDMLENNSLKVAQATSYLVDSWSGRSMMAFLDTSSHLQQVSSNCTTGLDQAISSCQSAAESIDNALPALFHAQSATQEAENGGVNEMIVKAIEDGNKAQANLTKSIDALTQAIELATEALGKCEEQTSGGGSSEEEDPFLEKLIDSVKDDLKDAAKETFIERLKEYIKEQQKEHSGGGSPAS